MPAIEFYYLPESPPCRAVEMVASNLGVTLNKHRINLASKEHLGEEYMKINPLHKVPFIIDGDLKMGESRAIMAYLVNQYMPSDDALYPKDPKKRAKVDELLAYDMGTLWQSASTLLRPMLFGGAKTLDPVSEKALREVLEFMDKNLADGRKYYLGENITLGDISVAASMSFVKAFDFDISSYKSLTAYLDRLRANIKNYAEINDAATESMKKYVLSKLRA